MSNHKPHSDKELGDERGFLIGAKANVKITEKRLHDAILKKNQSEVKKQRAELKERKRLVKLFTKTVRKMERANKKWEKAQKKK